LPDLSGLKSEIIVVDNASTDGSVELVRTRFPWVRLLENHQNAGFGKANNQAYRQCSGRYILLLNPDTELRPGALELLIAYMEKNPQAGISGARLLNTDGSLQQSCYREPTPARELWSLFHFDKFFPGLADYNVGEWDLNRNPQVEVLKGACMLLRREAINDQQLFDEAYFMYSEEVDLCRRIRASGWSLNWVPQAEVVHHEGQSTRQAAGSMFLHLYQAKLLYFRKNSGGWAARYYKIVLLLAALARLAVAPLAWLEHPDNRRRHLALASRYWELLRLLPEM
jgi:GT2 family glycosyltransferase